MLKYILRRVLYMVPIVFGIIIVTFILFNVAGGDPALIKLGKNAVPETLEAYDVQRGYDKPLFFGNWGRTRAYSETDFAKGAGQWSVSDGVIYTNYPCPHLILKRNFLHTIPTAFIPSVGTYCWDISYSSEGTSYMGVGGQRVALPASKSWKTMRIVFEISGAETGILAAIQTGESDLKVKNLRLRKKTRNFFDSQFFFYLLQVSRFDLGVSHDTNEKISRMLIEGVGPSLMLMIPIFIFEFVISIVLALICAFFRNTLLDRFFVVVAVALMSINYLVWIILGQYFLGYRMGWFPVWGFESWRYLLLPVIVGVISGLGSSLRFYRTIMLDEMYKDYVRTAFAKGAGRNRVLFIHVLRNAMIPILTNVIMTIPFLYTGSLLLERMFGIPGLGNMAYEGILNADVDVIRAVVLVGAVIYVVANLVTDVCYALADPRVRLE